MRTRPLFLSATSAAATALLLAGCASPAPGGNAPASASGRSATILRTTHGVPHITAPDFETLAYGVAYAHAQDNVCQTAQQLLTVRGERSRHLGPTAMALLGRRPLPNAQIDFFIAAHMDDAALDKAWKAEASADSQAMVRGYVAGYNRYLADHAEHLPAGCKGQPWVQPMTAAQFFRLQEVSMVQAGIGALADAMVGAQPPAAKAAALPAMPLTLAITQADDAAREMGLADSPLGSNAWAFGKDSTRTGAGLLVGNPHFPWAGVNRFWQMHLTIPGRLDAMGASTGHGAIVHIGFNKDVAWSHTVSTGKRFTLHELKLVPGEPTSYLVDGQPEKMTSRTVSIQVRGADGQLSAQSRTLWSTRWGPVISAPPLGLAWGTERAYALKDANTLNARASDAWLSFATAKRVQDLHTAHRTLAIPWVNTIAADREGQAMYTDVSVVPNVDEALLKDCAPSPQAAGLLRSAAGIVVLDGSKSACDWKRDPASPVPGLTPVHRMPLAVRSDWVHNSNDSFFYTHPAQKFEGIGFMIGDDVVRRARTRAGLVEVPELVARGPVTMQAAQAQLFSNRNFMAQMVLPDLLLTCANVAGGAPNDDAKDGCAALGRWDRLNNLDSRGAHLFREFWRVAANIPGVYRVPFDKAQPVATPSGLKMADATVGPKVWDALTAAVKATRAAGIALDAPLSTVQRPQITEEAIALHGGSEVEGVLNNLGNQFAPAINAKGLRIDYGSSYIQTVTFDARGPVAQAVLTYGQSTNPASPHANDQMRLFSAKQWPRLPFHPEDVAREAIGPMLTLTRP
jgi:acyl-homoserine-lactone acylase